MGVTGDGAGASIDYLDIAGHDFPVGAEFVAVIRNRMSGPDPPRWYYLMIP